MMMQLVTTRDRIRHVNSAWYSQYYHYKLGGFQDDKNRLIYDALTALDRETATAADIEAIIGNASWTNIRCKECGELVDEAVILNYGDEYHTFTICETCNAEAFTMFIHPDIYQLTPELQAVLDILKREPIRAIDGRYSDGFIDGTKAQYLVLMGLAYIQESGGYEFWCIVEP
jgi:hypothetical protein